MDECPAAQSDPQLRPVLFGQAVLKVLYLAAATWPNTAAPTSGSAVRAGNGRCRRSRSTSRDESQPMTVAMITYTADRTLPRAAPREEIPVASAGDQSVIVVVGEGSDLDSNSACLPVRTWAHGRCCQAGGGGGPPPRSAMRRRKLKMIIMRHGAGGRCRWRLTVNITAVVSR
jgi:hypothetical protein